MKQLVNLFTRQAKNQGRKSERVTLRRQLRNETLEKRQLLAGDLLAGELLPAHNYTIPEDVSGDWQVTPLDALLVLNYISKSGGNPSLEGVQRGDLEHFVDVTATNDVTPLDALRVMNRIARAEAVDELLELRVNPRTAGDEAFSASAFNAATRELTVGVNEPFNLEILYTDLRGTFDRAGAFAIYTDILVDNPGILEPVLTETQLLTVSANLRQADGGSIVFGFAGPPDGEGNPTPPLQTVTVNFEDFAASTQAPAIEIRKAIEQLGFSNVAVIAQPGGPTDPFRFDIRFNDFSLADQDLPNLVVTPQLTDSSGAPLNVTATVNDVKPRNADGTINQQAVPLNVNFFSRTYKVSPEFPFGEPFYGFASTQVGTFNPATGYIDLGATGPLLINGFPDANAGPLPRPFDAFSVPVRLTQEVEDFRIFLDPPNTSSTANLFYGRTEPIPNDLIRIDRDVDPTTENDDFGVLFVTAVADAQEVVVTAPDLTRIATQGGPAVTIAVRDLITVQNGDPATATVAIVSQPNVGSAAVDAATGVITFAPPTDQSGTTTFVYSATVGGVTDTGTVSVTVSPQQVVTVNAADGTLTADQNGGPETLNLATLVTVTGSTAAPSFAIVTQPTRGTLLLNGSTVSYTPAAGQVGADSFTYSATVDGVTDTATINVTIEAEAVTVNAADSTLAAVQNGGAQTLNLAPLVTVTGSTTTPAFTIDSLPTRGTLTITGSTVTYTPTAGQVGADSFTYRATVDGATDTGTINVTINPQAVTVSAGDSSLTAEQNGGARTLNLAPLVTVTGSTTAPTFTVASQPTRGTVTITGSTLTYTPAAGQVGADSFTYRATVDGASDTGTINVTINPQAVTVNAADSTLTAVQNGGAQSLNLAPLVSVTGSTATPSFALDTLPTRGTVTIAGSTVTYTPIAGQVGSDTFTYTATVNGVSDTGTIAVTINPQAITVNAADATLAADQNGGPRLLNLAPLVSVTGSTATPTFAIVGQPARGTASISGTTLTYTPATGQSGTDSLTYRATVNGVSDTGTITVNIAPIVAPPVARNDSFNVPTDVTRTFTSAQLTANDSAASPNPSGLPPRVTAAAPIAGTTQGTVVFNAADGSVTYTPPAGFTGTDSFRYTMTSEGQTATATVTVNVSNVPLSSISGSIFNDFIQSLENQVRNGVRDASEPAIGGVTVRLTGPGGEQVRLTDGQGNYSFANLLPGRYTVTFELPETLIFGTRVNGSNQAVSGSGRSFVVDIPDTGGSNFTGLNFTVLGKTGAAAGSSSLLVSQYSLTNPNAPNNINNPDFGLATMILDADGSQDLFELGKGYENVLFAEIAIGKSGESAILTVIMADGSVKSAILGKNEFLVSSNGAVVHVLRSIEGLNFLNATDDALAVEYGDYRAAVDEILAAGMF